MAHNTLSEKLDQISKEDLRVPFDQQIVWNQLESRFMQERTTSRRWWMLAACFFFVVFLTPVGLLQEMTISGTSFDHQAYQVIEPIKTQAKKYTQNALKQRPSSDLEQKEEVGVEVLPRMVQMETAKVDLILSGLEKIEIKNDRSKSFFAAEDISIIQASLEGSSTEKGKKLLIRAKWQTYPTSTNINHQGLKIKLNENN